MKILLLLLLFLIGVSAMPPSAGAEEPIHLRITTRDMHDVTVRDLNNGEIEITTTGTDPYLFTEPISQPFDSTHRHIVSFEFFSATGTDHMQVFLVPPLDEEHSIKAVGLPHSEGWSSYALDLKPVFDKFKGKYKDTVRSLRLDFGGFARKVIRVRALQLRDQTPQEKQLAARHDALQEAEQHRDVRLREYLHHNYPCSVTGVTVGDSRINIRGEITGERNGLFLAESPMYWDVTEEKSFPTLIPIHATPNGRFTVNTDRYRRAGKPANNIPNRTATDHGIAEQTALENNAVYDRLLSRWAVVRRNGAGYELLSHARYTDAVHPRWDLPEEKPRNKKGIGGLGLDRPLSDIADLGLSAATVNIVLNSLFHAEPGPGRTAFTYSGRTLYADDHNVADLDKTLIETAKHRLIVSAIILLGQGQNDPPDSFSHRIAHPDADPSGIFVMPNVQSEDGLLTYAAALDYLAQRYSRPDSRFGRIHHWIMHNEVNAGWVWTNAGDKTPLLYMDLYQRSLRIAHLIARQYNPYAKAFISLEHHWNMRPTRIYAGRELLDLLLDFSKTEGDFDWAIAFHPYPQNLFDPHVWADNEVAFAFDTPKITFKNLEVLDAWIRQPRALYLGKQPRVIHLTEQGLNSPDYTDKSLQAQAAGMAYAWNKYKNLPTIEVFDYHNWVDNRGEGGLRIGLRRFPDDKDDPLGRKPIWYVYRSLGTPDEESILAPYKSIIGIKDWSEVRFTGKIR